MSMRVPESDPLSMQFLITDAPLYRAYDIADEPYQRLTDIKYFTGAIDAYCMECQSSSTFRMTSNPRADIMRAARSGGLPVTPVPRQSLGTRDVTDPGTCADVEEVLHLEFDCARDNAHRMLVSLYVRKGQLIKIGQYPSFSDLEHPKLRKYTSVLTSDEQDELRTATLLYNHRIGIGSFIYLRRIFENLVEKAHVQARKEDRWNETEYETNANHMDQKIRLLREFLPELLVEKSKTYNILSKGIHSWNECECIKLYPILRAGIEIMLEEAVEKKEKEERRKRFLSAF